uniref:Uncharacterized protein n=1 Tax=viral metagenome TaxID=1070528 RepID=A0A6C0J5T0_9ZZZZ
MPKSEEDEAVDTLKSYANIRTISKPGVKSEDEKIHEAAEALEKLKSKPVEMASTSVHRTGNSRRTRHKRRRHTRRKSVRKTVKRKHHH